MHNLICTYIICPSVAYVNALGVAYGSHNNYKLNSISHNQLAQLLASYADE